MDNWINLVSNLGFPIAITIFQMLKLDRSLQELAEEIRQLRNTKKGAWKGIFFCFNYINNKILTINYNIVTILLKIYVKIHNKI